MSAEYSLTSLKVWCIQQSGNEQIWTNKGTTYQWTRGKDTTTGMVNGVVRKVAGVDNGGNQIWVVAGSFKIDAAGSILRFTGVPKKIQKTFEPHPQTVAAETVTL